jgi:two-component system NarL family sensor kinase
MYYRTMALAKFSLAFLISALFLGACQEKSDNAIIYKKPIAEKMDPVYNWLAIRYNFNKPQFKRVFYTYYNKKIKEKKYKSAAKILEVVSLTYSSYTSFDSTFTKTITYFSDHYKDKVPAINATFIDTYIGDYYSDKGDFKKAIYYYQLGAKLEVVDYETCFKRADGFRTISWSYLSMGKTNLALDYNEKALVYYDKLEDLSEKGNVYFNYVSIYEHTRDYVNAEKSSNKAIYYFSKNKKIMESTIFVCLYNKIVLYETMNSLNKRNLLIDSTYHAYKKSKMEDSSMKISINTYYVLKLLEENKINEAKNILDNLKPEVLVLNSVVSTREYDMALASYEIKKNKGLLNPKIILDAIPTLKENKTFEKVRDLYSVLYDDALAKKDFKLALNYFKELANVRDSLGSKDMQNKVMELDKKYKTKNKIQKIALQEKSIQNKNTTIALLISLFTALLLFVIFIITRHKQNKLKLEKQNIQMYMKQLLEKTEEERKRIASDLHDSVSHELLSLKNSIEEKSEKTNQKIDAIINDIRSISRNLHPIMFDKIGLKASIEQMVERVQKVNNFLVTADVDYVSSLSTSSELQLYRILQEALSNVIKYSDALAAKITIYEKNDIIYIEVKDNGKGFDVNGTLNQKESFGLHNIIERSRAIGGEAKIVSNKNGTIVSIEIKNRS